MVVVRGFARFDDVTCGLAGLVPPPGMNDFGLSPGLVLRARILALRGALVRRPRPLRF